MNIQRIKKRKIVKIEKTEQQMAKEKLFEISYLCDEKDIDQSQVWSTNHRIDTEAQTVKMEAEIHDIIEKKKDNFFKRRKYRTLQTEKSDSVQKYNKTCSDYFLFNTVDSNRVFVANKSNFKTNFNNDQQSNTVLVLQKIKKTSPAYQSQSQCYYHYIRGMLANKQKRQIDYKNRTLYKTNKNFSYKQTYNSLQKYRGKSTDDKFKDSMKSIILQNIQLQLPQKN